MRLTWLGHSSVVLDIDGVRILTDPLLCPHAGLLRRLAPRPDPASWIRPDAVLLSHLHHDHAEFRSLRMLRGAALMSAPANVAWLRRRKLMHTVPLGDGWTPVGSGVQVRQVPAEHRSRPMPHRPNDANGQLVRGPSGIVWIAGDTGLFPEMAALPAMAGGPDRCRPGAGLGVGTAALGGTPDSGDRRPGCRDERRAVRRAGALGDAAPSVRHTLCPELARAARAPVCRRRGGAGSWLHGSRPRPRPVMGGPRVSRRGPGAVPAAGLTHRGTPSWRAGRRTRASPPAPGGVRRHLRSARAAPP